MSQVVSLYYSYTNSLEYIPSYAVVAVNPSEIWNMNRICLIVSCDCEWLRVACGCISLHTPYVSGCFELWKFPRFGQFVSGNSVPPNVCANYQALLRIADAHRQMISPYLLPTFAYQATHSSLFDWFLTLLLLIARRFCDETLRSAQPL